MSCAMFAGQAIVAAAGTGLTVISGEASGDCI
jgi:hypothetical protein